MFDFDKIINLGFVSLPLYKILNTFLIIIFCSVASRIMLVLLDRSLKRFSREKKNGPFLRPIVKFFLVFLSTLVVLEYLSISVATFVAMLGVVGVALSLALQDVLSNIAGGAMLFFSRPFTAGNFIEVGGITGRVKAISLVYTELLTNDNKTIYIPNRDISSSRITNYTANEKRMAEAKILVPYDCPSERVKDALLSAVEKTPGILDDPRPAAVVSGLKETSVEYSLRAWVKTEEYGLTNFALLENVRSALADARIPMARNLLAVRMDAQEQEN